MEKGFSLIEVLIVLVILSSLISISIMKPIGSFYYDVSKVRNLVSYAYNYSFSSGRNVRLYYYENSNKLVLRAGSKSILSVNLKYSKITNYPYFKNMEFKASGTVTPTGMIVLKDLIRENHYNQIIISMFGRISVKDLHY
jgi:prepilin-type N-terminal cleavage/methylation domain-containing protein